VAVESVMLARTESQTAAVGAALIRGALVETELGGAHTAEVRTKPTAKASRRQGAFIICVSRLEEHRHNAQAQLRALCLSTLAMNECKYLMPATQKSALQALVCCSAR